MFFMTHDSWIIHGAFRKFHGVTPLEKLKGIFTTHEIPVCVLFMGHEICKLIFHGNFMPHEIQLW